MAAVRAIAIEAENTSITSSGSDTAVHLGSDVLTAGEKWLDARSFLFLTVFVHADTAANGNTCSFTIEGKTTANHAAQDIYAKAATASNTAAYIAEAVDIKKYAYVRVLEHGTANDVQKVHLLMK